MKKLFSFDLKFNWKIVIATISTTLLLIVDNYHRFTESKALDRFYLYLIIPLIIIVVVLREDPKDYGFQLGDWKAGLALTGLVLFLSRALDVVFFPPSSWQVVRTDPVADRRRRSRHAKVLPETAWARSPQVCVP